MVLRVRDGAGWGWESGLRRAGAGRVGRLHEGFSICMRKLSGSTGVFRRDGNTSWSEPASKAARSLANLRSEGHATPAREAKQPVLPQHVSRSSSGSVVAVVSTAARQVPVFRHMSGVKRPDELRGASAPSYTGSLRSPSAMSHSASSQDCESSFGPRLLLVPRTGRQTTQRSKSPTS